MLNQKPNTEKKLMAKLIDVMKNIDNDINVNVCGYLHGDMLKLTFNKFVHSMWKAGIDYDESILKLTGTSFKGDKKRNIVADDESKLKVKAHVASIRSRLDDSERNAIAKEASELSGETITPEDLDIHKKQSPNDKGPHTTLGKFIALAHCVVLIIQYKIDWINELNKSYNKLVNGALEHAIGSKVKKDKDGNVLIPKSWIDKKPFEILSIFASTKLVNVNPENKSEIISYNDYCLLGSGANRVKARRIATGRVDTQLNGKKSEIAKLYTKLCDLEHSAIKSKKEIEKKKEADKKAKDKRNEFVRNSLPNMFTLEYAVKQLDIQLPDGAKRTLPNLRKAVLAYPKLDDEIKNSKTTLRAGLAALAKGDK